MRAEAAVARACEQLRRAEVPAAASARSAGAMRRRARGSESARERAFGGDGVVRRLAAQLRAGAVTSEQLVTAALARAEAADRALGCVVELLPERALRAARAADAQLARGEDRGPLHGVPFAVKDVIDVAGTWTRLGTRGLGHHRAEADAAAVAALTAAGAIPVAVTTTHELAWGATTPQTGNPFDAARTPGGSSGGSGAAVGAGVVPFALGTDTGGSVRVPAALCGVVGLRPTHGAIPLAGVAPLAPGQDTVGVLAATADDCALAFAALARAPLAAPAGRLRVGVPGDRWVARTAAEMAAPLDAAHAALAEAGVELVPVELPGSELAPAASWIVMLAESAAHWRRACERDPSGASDALGAVLRLGGGIAAEDYLCARAVSGEIAAAVRATLEQQALAALVLPSTATAAPLRGAAVVRAGGREEAVESALTRHAALAAVTGLPALSVPAGLDAAGLPVGLQALGAPGGEGALLALAAVVEASAPARAVAARRADQIAGLAPPSNGTAAPVT